jgi:hypothetical protein
MLPTLAILFPDSAMLLILLWLWPRLLLCLMMQA